MPRRPIGERAMTDAERQARSRARRAERDARWRGALERVRAADAAALETLTDRRGEPIGEWTSEPLPESGGRWARLSVLRAAEWSPVVLAGRELEAARAVAALDLQLALFGAPRPGPALDALRRLVAEDALLREDPPTAEMLAAFGL